MTDYRWLGLAILAVALACEVVGAAELKRVPRILDVTYEWQESAPPNLVVRVKGEVPTAGWTEPYLIPRTYVNPPADGIWEYDFFLKPPEGIAAQVLTEVKANHTWKGVKEKLKGVRVYGVGKGVKEIKFK